MNKSKNNPKGREDQAQPDSKTPPGACEAKTLAPNVDSILTEIGKINGTIGKVKDELATLAAKPDVDLTPVNTLIEAVNSGFSQISTDIQALTEAQSQAQANAASKDDLKGLATQSDIDQLKQMISGLAFGMGDVKAGVSGLHGKVDVIGEDTTEIKAGVGRIESKVDMLVERMSLVVDELHAIRESLNALEQKADALGNAVAEVKKDTQYIPQMAQDLQEFRVAFDGTARLIVQTLAANKSDIVKSFTSKIDSYNQNVNKLSASVSQASKHIIDLSDSAGNILSDINQISIKARGAINMSEAALRAVADSGAEAVGEQLFEKVKGWIDPLINNIKTACSEEAFVVMASSIATSSEKIASGVQALNNHADDIQPAVDDLKRVLELMVSAKAISHEEFISRTNELDAAYKKIAGHLEGVEKKAGAATASVEKFDKYATEFIDEFTRVAAAGLNKSLESRMNGMLDHFAEKVSDANKNDMVASIKDSVRAVISEMQEESITP